jgi:hypothetical protein
MLPFQNQKNTAKISGALKSHSRSFFVTVMERNDAEATSLCGSPVKTLMFHRVFDQQTETVHQPFDNAFRQTTWGSTADDYHAERTTEKLH